MLVKMYINAHYICAMCRNSKSVAKKVAIFKNKKQNKKCLTFITTCIKLNIVAAIHNQLIHQLAAYRNVAQLGRALRSGRRGRVFESRHSDSSRISVRICEQILGRGGRAGLEFI